MNTTESTRSDGAATTALFNHLKRATLASGVLIAGTAVIAALPVVGAVGLFCTGIRTVHDVARYHLAQYSAQKAQTPQLLNERKIAYYKCRLHENKLYTRVFGTLLIPVAGLFMTIAKGEIIASAVTSVVDIAGVFPSVKRKILRHIFIREGETLEDLGRNTYLNTHAWFQQQLLHETKPSKREYWKQQIENLENFHSDKTESQRYKLWFQERTREPLLEKSRGIQLTLKTGDQRTIDAVWVPNGRVPVTHARTVIMFHGNGCILDTLEDTMKLFKRKGLNVLMLTMGGYPGSAEGHPITESSLYHDVEAAGNYLKELNIRNDQMIAYGLSLGGALAIQYGVSFPGSHVIADQTFTSIGDVTKNVLRTPLNNPFLDGIVKKIFADATPTIERLVEHILFPHGHGKGNTMTNGLNSLAKIPKLQGNFYVIQSKDDELMHIHGTEKNYGDILADTYASIPNNVKRIVTIPGGHGEFLGSHPEAVSMLEAFH